MKSIRRMLGVAVTVTCTMAVLVLADGNSAEAQTSVSQAASASGSDTNTEPLLGPAFQQALDFFSAGSNWMIAPYGIASADGKKFGGGIGAGYKINDYMAPTLRLDYYDGKVWMPSGSLQLQLPITYKSITVVPFAFSGIATPISGMGNNNGGPVGIFGVGGALRIGTHWDIIGDYESWTGFASKQVRFGFVFKF